jgi:hypothetical protein
MVLVATAARVLARPSGDWPIRYVLRSVPPRDDCTGGDQLSMQERLANIASLSMCRAWDMDEPTQDTTASKSLVFLGTS